MSAIYKRELKSYFHNMTGAIFMAAVLFFLGIYFVAYNIAQGYPYFAVSLSGVSMILLLVIPILTMRSFAEERKLKTDQLWLTAPISITKVVLGKFFAMISILGICMLVACLCPLIIHFYGGGAFLGDYMGILAFFVMASAYISLGMFISALTESQVISAVLTLALLLLLQLLDGIAGLLPTTSLSSYICFFVLIVVAGILLYVFVKNIYIACGAAVVGVVILTILYLVKNTIFESAFPSFLSSLSLIVKYEEIANQVLNLSTFVYYISIICIFVFLTVQVIQKRRWS